jgi:putative membrane protein
MAARVSIDAAGRMAIEAAVREAERATSGEIVVFVARACDEYGSAGWRCGVLFAAAVLLGLGLFGPPLALVPLVAAQAAALLAGHALARIPAVRRAFVSEALLQRAAERRAAAAFAEHGLHRTAGRTGILMLVALFERRVVLLADEGVHRRLAPGHSWQEVVELALAGIREGRAADGIAAAVGRCGEVLAGPLPAALVEHDEIRLAVVIED